MIPLRVGIFVDNLGDGKTIMNSLRAFKKLILLILEILGGVLLVTMPMTVFIGIMDRFWLHIGFPWPEELARYHLIWLSFLSAALAVTNKGHYVIAVFYKTIFKYSKQRIIVECAVNLLVCILSVVLLIKGSELVIRVAWQGAPAMNISMSWVYFPIPLSLGLILFFYMTEIVENVFFRESREN
jgi:TRAP-type C4-dicarboxylate transport system permease small subunit